MATGNLSTFLRRLTRGRAAQTLGQQTDRQLAERFLAGRDEAAFEALVRRHGPMVYRVCWRVLQQAQDAEDAFQATFLLLARKLPTVRKHDSVASWLHGVAHRVALKSRAQASARRRREQQAAVPEAATVDELTWRELRAVLDAELAALPEKWRLPLILCYLEGWTQDEAAGQLRWGKNTLRRRLEEAREALGRRLARRGVGFSAALGALLLCDRAATATVPPHVVASTVEAAVLTAAGRLVAGAVSADVIALTEGVVKAMFRRKLKIAAGVLAAACAVTCGAALLLTTASAVGQSERKNDEAPKKADVPKEEKARPDEEAIQGTWKIAREETNGAESPDSQQLQEKCKWVITADKITVEFDGQTQDFTYKLDPKKTPRTFDMTDPGGQKIEGIYSLQGDELKICTALNGAKRPQEFDTKSGEAELVVLKRAR